LGQLGPGRLELCLERFAIHLEQGLTRLHEAALPVEPFLEEALDTGADFDPAGALGLGHEGHGHRCIPCRDAVDGHIDLRGRRLGWRVVTASEQQGQQSCLSAMFLCLPEIVKPG